ncbi:MAG: hypothetical protein R3D80_13335 [Paracoccaceae bacterium]
MTATVTIVSSSQFVCFVDRIRSGVGIADDDFTFSFAVFHTLFNTFGVVS